jgi:hypothetical protein
MIEPTMTPIVRFFSKGVFTQMMRTENAVGVNFHDARVEVVRVGKQLRHQFFNDDNVLIGVWTRTGQFVRQRVR